MALFFSCLWCAAVIYLIFHAYRQQNVLRQVVPSPAPESLPAVTIIVPARNESGNIGLCVNSLLGQDYPPERLQVIVIDDASSDDTADIVAAIAERRSQVKLLHAPPLRPGWKGKVNACCAGTRAVCADAEWLCFLDADMRAHPKLMASAVAAARDGDIDCLSLSPRHELKSFAERLMIPCGLYMLSFSQDLSRLEAPDCKDVTVTGQFMLMRRSAYENVGGHAAVPSAICEDYELAALLKNNGYRVALQDGTKVLTTRMYTGWRDLWPGIAKNLVHMVGGPRPTIALTIAALVMAWAAVLLPIIDAYGCANASAGACMALAPATLGSAIAFGLHLVGTGYFGIPLWYGLLFPIGYTAGSVLAIDSLRRRWTGYVTWKGRVYQ